MALARVLLSVLLSFALIFASPCHALEQTAPELASRTAISVETELWHLALARITAYQPGRVGIEDFIATFDLEKNLRLPEDRKTLRALRAMKNFPHLSVEGNELVLREGNAQHRFGLRNLRAGEFSLDGHVFTLNNKESLTTQMERVLEEAQRTKAAKAQASLLHSITEWILPSADAKSEGDIPVDGLLTSLAGVAGAFFGGGFALTKTAGAVVAGGATIGLGATTGIVVGGAVAAAGLAMAAGCTIGIQFWNQIDSRPSEFGPDFHNCMASPLSLVGMNYRDRLYLKEIKCPSGSDSMDVKLESPSGIQLDRKFTLSREGRSLESIQVSESGAATATLFLDSSASRIERGEAYRIRDSGARTRTRRLARPAQNEILDTAQVLVRDFEYYHGLCVDPDRLRQVRAAIARGERGERAADVPSAGQFHRSGK